MANKEWLTRGVDGLTFGERLGDLISSREINQSQLAEQTGIKQSAISEYINGRKNGADPRSPDCATIIELSKFFGVSTDYLLGQSERRSQNIGILSVCEYSGLSEQAVTSLKAYSKQSISFISEFLEKAEITHIDLLYENLKRSRKKLHTYEQICSGIDKSSTTAADLDMMKKLHDAKEKAEFDRWKLERSIMTILDKMMEGK